MKIFIGKRTNTRRQKDLPSRFLYGLVLIKLVSGMTIFQTVLPLDNIFLNLINAQHREPPLTKPIVLADEKLLIPNRVESSVRCKSFISS